MHDTGERSATVAALEALAGRIARKHGEATHCEMLSSWARGVADGTVYPADVPPLLRRARIPHHLRPWCEQTAAELEPLLTANPPITSRTTLSALRKHDLIRFDGEPVRLRVTGTRWAPGLRAYAISFDGLGERTYLASEAITVTRYERQEISHMEVVKTRGGFTVAQGGRQLSEGGTKRAAEQRITEILEWRASDVAFQAAREQRVTDAGWTPCAPANLRPGWQFTYQKANNDLGHTRTVERVELLDSGAAMIYFSDQVEGCDTFILWTAGTRTFTRPAPAPDAGETDPWEQLAQLVTA